MDGELVGGGEGRVTISSVLFGLRNYSTEGAVLAVHVRDKTEAAALATDVINNSGKRLWTNYGDNFDISEVELRVSVETTGKEHVARVLKALKDANLNAKVVTN